MDECVDAGPSDLLEQLKDWFNQSRDYAADWRKEAEEDYAFVAGHQWSQEDIDKLQNELRPVITFNRIAPVTDAVSGMEVSNRQEVRFYPRQIGSTSVNDLLSGAAKLVRDECDAEDEESDAFLDVIICGMGWTESRPDYDQDPAGKIVIERLDPLDIFWDPDAKKRNLSDARYVMLAREIAVEDARAMFPDVPDDALDAGWTNMPRRSGPHDATQAKFYREDQSGRDPAAHGQTVRIVYAEWWDRETYYDVADPQTGQAAALDQDGYDRLVQRATMLGISFPSVKRTRKAYKCAFVGNEVLESGPARCPFAFTMRAITGKRDRNANTWYGLVRAMKDPQRWANKWLSQALHILNSNSKGGLLAERDAFDNPRKAEEEWADPTAITWLRPGGLAKVQPKGQTEYPQSFDKLIMLALSAIRDATGVNLEVLGMADRQQAGILEYQRKQSGMTILAGLFDSLRRYRKEQGRVLLYYIRNFLSDGRLVRISGPQGAQYVPLLRDSLTAEYDVVVDDAPSSPNQKEQVWGMLMQLMPVLSALPIPGQIWLELLKYSPLPDSLVQTISGIASRRPPPNQALQLDLAGKAADIAETKSKTIANLARAGATHLGAKTDAIQTIADVMRPANPMVQ